MRGSVIVTFEEGKQSFGSPYYEILVNSNDTRDYQWSEANSLYSTYIFSGNTLSARVRGAGYGEIPFINLSLVEYTNDDVAGDNGIKTTTLTGITGNNINGFLHLSDYPINPSANCYDFKVVVSFGVTQGCAPIGSVFATSTGATQATTCEIKTKNVGVSNPDDGMIYIGIQSTATNNSYTGSTAGGVVGRLFRLNKTYVIDSSFDSRAALSNTYYRIHDIEIQNDGKPIIGGAQLSSLDMNLTGYSLNRLTTTGALDPAFTRYPFNGGPESVTDVVQQSDGKIIASGNFTQINGLTYNRYARFNYDGTIDNTYYSGGTGTGFGSAVNCEIDVRNDKVYFFGVSFGTFNGTTFGCLLRLNANGQLDTTFGNGGRASFSFASLVAAAINDVKVLPDGKILCSGSFDRYNGQPCPRRIVRLNEDGTLDTTFNPEGAGLVFSNLIFTLFPTENLNEDENKYLIVGNFTGATYNGVSVPNDIFFLNSDGSLGNNTNLGTGITGDPKTCKLLDNGSYLITGTISSFNGTSITNGGMIQLSSTGQLQNC
jgi:uncharacterized delta-60 repeat protein